MGEKGDGILSPGASKHVPTSSPVTAKHNDSPPWCEVKSCVCILCLKYPQLCSIDNLVVGFELSFSSVPILFTAGVIAVVSVALSRVGLELGKHLGKRLEQWSEEVSGGIIILVGLARGVGFL